MSDYFEAVKAELVNAVDRRVHIRWYQRVRRPAGHRGLVVVVAALVIASPAVAAVGAASGWFSPGKPEAYHPWASTSGLGKALADGDRTLPLRVADPDGGPPWALRLVRTTRGDTCIQLGRVEGGEIGSLGIDGTWGNDHRFHQINPNDDDADICGTTDGAGQGFVDYVGQGAPSSGYAFSSHQGPSKRFIFTGLLGPDAKSVTYQTPSGQTKTEQTSGGVGAYLIVVKETKANCNYYIRTLLPTGVTSCEGASGGFGYGLGPVLHSAVTSITYKNGTTCDVQRSQCALVGWVTAKTTPVMAADVTSPLTVSISLGRRFCDKDPQTLKSDAATKVACDGRIPAGYTSFPNGPVRAKWPLLPLVRVSFTAREPVTSSNSFYALQIQSPLGGTGFIGTDWDIRRGETVTLTMTSPVFRPHTESPLNGVYHGTISYTPNAGKAVPEQNGSLLVGRFSFKLPLKK